MSYRGLILLQEPDLYLPLEEAIGGVAADVTGNGYDGIYNGIQMNAGSGFSVFGGSVTSAYWDGAGHVSIPKKFQARGAFSASFWYRPQVATGYPVLMHLTGCMPEKYNPMLVGGAVSDGKPYIEVCSNTGAVETFSSSTAETVAGRLVHCCLVVRARSLKIYFNGVPRIQANMVGMVQPASKRSQDAMFLGAGQGYLTTPGNFFKGWLSNFAMFSRALSESEVLDQYHVGSAAYDQKYVSGFAVENGLPAHKKRFLYIDRATGIVRAAGDISDSGNVVLRTPGATEGYVVCLDDSDARYEPQIYDRIMPLT